MSNPRSRLSFVVSLLSVGVLAASCATPGPNPNLERAEGAVGAAQAKAVVREQAEVELDQAQEELQRARDAYAANEDPEEVDNLAYVAEQRAAIAEAIASARKNDAEIEALGEHREAILFEAQKRKKEAAERKAAAAAREAENARFAAAKLQEELAELSAKQTERGLVLTLGDILFDFDKSALNPGGKMQVTRLAQFLKEIEQKKVTIEGHTDSAGSSQYNVQLSQQRADAVMRELLAQGVKPTRIVARGLGEGYPVASNATEAGRQQNRRVDIIIE